jgi:hypothetical protein
MRKSSKKKTKKVADKQPPEPHEPVPSADEAKPFDFGGLPDRDLKKNLGCGG